MPRRVRQGSSGGRQTRLRRPRRRGKPAAVRRRHRRRRQRRHAYADAFVSTRPPTAPPESGPFHAGALTRIHTLAADARAQWREVATSSAPAICVAIALGGATTAAIVGLIGRMEQVLVGSVSTPRTVTSGALLALATGLSIPRGVATWLCVRAWRRFVAGETGSDAGGALVGRAATDRTLYWIVLSVVALAAGVTTALLPLVARMGAGVYRWLHVHFVWSTGPLEALHLMLVFAIGVVPFALIGLALGCAHRLSSRVGLWDTTATGWWLVGAGAAFGVLPAHSAPDLLLLLAALPSLLVAVLAATLSARLPARDNADPRDEARELPLWSDRWPRLLRAGIVAVGAAGAGAVVLFAGALPRGTTLGLSALSPILLSMGAGVLVACYSRPHRLRSIGGFGVASASAGVATALVAAVLNRADHAGALVPAIVVCACTGAIAYALAYGRKTLLDRVASRASAGAKIMARLLGFSALTIWIIAPALTRLGGQTTTIVLVALLLLALGGLLIIHEPGYSPATRQARLAAVFGALGTMILLSSLPANPWRPPPPAPAAALAGDSAAEPQAVAGTETRTRLATRR